MSAEQAKAAQEHMLKQWEMLQEFHKVKQEILGQNAPVRCTEGTH